jgi:predicted Rossmann fold nucleotide-binding protein DprA/Smf involved in DNA uptake
MDIDQLAAATALPAGDLMARLTELELFGQVQAVGGGRYQQIVQN